MIQITLPDGSRREYPAPVTVAEIAASIGAGLAKAAIAGKVDGKVVDTAYTVDRDAPVSIITAKDPEGLEVIRHSTAHLLAYAVKELFPEAQVTIGPVIENGFYYDFAYKRPFTPEDLAAIEKRMAELAARDEPVARRVLPRDAAVEYFKGIGEHYKAEIIASIPQNEEVSLYREGNFEDLCRGPHVPSTGKLRHFKLMKVAGAYWRGDHRNEMLQRVYGTAWASKEELQQYLTMLEEAEKRDHRKLGRELDLFHIDDVAPGVVFWHPKGWAVWQEVEQYMRQVYKDTGYQEVKGPQILDKSLWEKTGHWQNYRENMFTTESEKRDYALKPMNCPGHVLIFKSALRSYRELPLRYGEFGQCHRNEPSGALHGIMRVRGFTQDDGHAFCTEDQILDECVDYTAKLQKVYKDFGFTDILYKVATRPAAAGRLGRTVGQGRARLHGGAAPLRRRIRGVAGRRRVLRTEDRVHAQGRAGPPVAVRHHAGRLQHGRAAGRGIRHGDQWPRPPGDAAPGHRRQPGALHRHAHRAPCRRPAGLAGAGAGRRAEHHGRTGRLGPGGCKKSAESRLQGGARPAQREDHV